MLGGDVLKSIGIATAPGTFRPRLVTVLPDAPHVRVLGPARAGDRNGSGAAHGVPPLATMGLVRRPSADGTISFAAGLRYARERAGLSRIDLAVAAGVPIRRLRQLERGGEATSPEQERLANVLRLRPQDLVAADRVIGARITAALSDVIEAAARMSPGERAALARAAAEPAHRQAIARCCGHLRSAGRGPLVDDARRWLRRVAGGSAAVSASTITAILAADLVPPKILALGLGPWRATIGRIDRLRSIRRRPLASVARQGTRVGMAGNR